ncbi:MAG: TrkH family potassium uptake protein [Candidatus Nanohaloarchaeota archaeon QJJ-5]|nr:TrkH family potassium uptake protein [Candidatus Nanohaloarchaeota archaeon QJJ-5]
MDRIVAYYLGLFLKIYSAFLLVPVAVGRYFGESFVQMEPFIYAAFISIVLGYALDYWGVKKEPDAIEGMLAATTGWIAAVAIGALPFMAMLNMGFVDAFFELMAGFTTTGMSILPDPAVMPHSLSFWRGFSQWIGGLGMLTFFVAVIIEAGGVAQSLLFAEADKTDAGTIRPSPINAIKSLWYVYIVFTALQATILYLLDLSVFDAVMYAFQTLPTGGFSHTAGGIAAFDSLAIEATFTVFMFIGGTNFLLLYLLLKGRPWAVLRNYEFRLMTKVLALALVIIGLDVWMNSGRTIIETVRVTVFMTVSVMSSTGFEPTGVRTFPELSKMIFLMLMFVGASLGSTTGGIKMLRFGVLLRVVIREVRSFSMPRSAVNPIMIGARRIKTEELLRIITIVTVWLTMIMGGAVITIVFSDLAMIEAIQGMTSSMGTMGPLFIEPGELIGLHPVVKLLWCLGMLAGRLEILPILILMNVEVVKRIRG